MDSINSNSDLVFNVAQLLKEQTGSVRKLDIITPELVLSEDSRSFGDTGMLEAHDVTGKVKLTLVSHDLLAQGKVAAQVTVACSRCLDEIDVPVEGKLEERYFPSVDVETGRPVQRQVFEEDDTAFSISANHEIDLTEPVRQAILVALPLKPLCREDCAGLCPQCGANLNNGPHSHESDTIDNRWAALQELKLEDLPPGNGNLN